MLGKVAHFACVEYAPVSQIQTGPYSTNMSNSKGVRNMDHLSIS